MSSHFVLVYTQIWCYFIHHFIFSEMYSTISLFEFIERRCSSVFPALDFDAHV